MTERQIPCPRCQQENPPSHRFCGSCGAPLMSGEQLATRQEHRPVRAASALPSWLGSVGKAVAVGVAVLLAAEAGLSWLQHRIGTEDRSSLPAVRGVGSASRGYLVGQSLEEVLQMWEDSHGRVVARREVRSFVSTGPTGRRR
jgi:Double zinc ribbon